MTERDDIMDGPRPPYSETRHRRRVERKMRRVPRDRRCPLCKKVKASLRRWSRRGTCLSCARKQTMDRRVAEIRYTVVGVELRRQRRRLGVTQVEFAAAAGWSQSYQSKLEGGTTIVSESTLNVICELLKGNNQAT